MKVIVHYPETDKEKELLAEKIAEVHSETVVQYLKGLTCGTSEKIKLLDIIAAETTDSQ